MLSIEDLLRELDGMRNTMIAVATGDAEIDAVSSQFTQAYFQVDSELMRLGIENPIPYASLWLWETRWTSGDFPTYSSRRDYASKIFDSLREAVQRGYVERPTQSYEPTGWARVDRIVGRLRDKLAMASMEEEFQAVGLLCREALISTGQAVFVEERHPAIDAVKPSDTDARRLLEAFISAEMSSGANDEARRHIKSALNLAVTLQHKRTATFRQAAMCVEATTSIVNIVAIVSGMRDPPN
jgi:hypothetical protein